MRGGEKLIPLRVIARNEANSTCANQVVKSLWEPTSRLIGFQIHRVLECPL